MTSKETADILNNNSPNTKNKKKKAWTLGFLTLTLFMIFVFFYTFYICDLTLYQTLIFAISFYTMATMGICLIFKNKQSKKINTNYRPFISIIVPAKNEEKVIEKTIRSLFEIDYSIDGNVNYEVLVVDDNSTDSTYSIIEKLKAEYPTLLPLKRIEGAKGKSAVLNYAIPYSKGELIAVFDADSKIEPDFFNKTVVHFYDETIVGAQGRVRIINRNQNFITKFQDDEFSIFAHMLQLSKAIYGGVMQLAGNGQLTRRSALLSVGGWNETSATDDQDLTAQFLLQGQFIQYVPDAIVWQEAITKIYPFLRQRIRWAEGMLKCIFDYFYDVTLSKKLSLLQKIDGLSGLMRIVATLVVWIGYIQLLTVIFFKLNYTCFMPIAMCNIYLVTSLALIVMASGLWKYSDKPNIFIAIKVIFYWFCNIFWLIAAPIGLYNCIKNRNKIEWDKTEHTG